MSGARSSNNFIENVGSSQFRETHGKSYPSALPNLTYGTNSRSDHFGNRVLPPSLMHAKSVSAAQYLSSGDPMHRPGVGEERVAEHDERLVYQAALQVFIFVSLCTVYRVHKQGLDFPSLINHYSLA